LESPLQVLRIPEEKIKFCELCQSSYGLVELLARHRSQNKEQAAKVEAFFFFQSRK
jgi:hypothetical protein